MNSVLVEIAQRLAPLVLQVGQKLFAVLGGGKSAVGNPVLTDQIDASPDDFILAADEAVIPPSGENPIFTSSSEPIMPSRPGNTSAK